MPVRQPTAGEYFEALKKTLTDQGKLGPAGDPNGELAAALNTISSTLGGGQAAASSGGKTSGRGGKSTSKGGGGRVQGTRKGKVQGVSGDAQTNELLQNMWNSIQMMQEQLAAKEDSPTLTLDQRMALEQGLARGMSDDELALLALRFKKANDLLDKNSEFYKKMEGTTMDEYMAELQKKIDDQQEVDKAKKMKEVEETMKRFATPAWFQVMQAALGAGGELASMAGNISQSYRGNLAQALLNAANTGTPGLSAQRAAAFGDPRANTGIATTASALKQQHIGNRNKAIGDSINRVTRILSGQLGAEQQQQRQLRTLLELDPTNEYYRTDFGRWRLGQQMARFSRDLQ